jgi:dihydrodipicolinate synthase/N-acetylneuraminate lyase
MALTAVKGIVGTPVTPFTHDNRVDRTILENIVRFLLDNGVAANGSWLPRWR